MVRLYCHHNTDDCIISSRVSAVVFGEKKPDSVKNSNFTFSKINIILLLLQDNKSKQQMEKWLIKRLTETKKKEIRKKWCESKPTNEIGKTTAEYT